MRILVVPDKFKGTLTARQACDCIAAGWSRARPGDVVETLPLSDGGDGFGEVFGGLLGATPRVTTTTDSAGLPREAGWFWSAARNTAIFETAQVNGLALLPARRFHPFQLDNTGLGPVLRAIASESDLPNLLLGIGGSATNDAGFGLAKVLGWRFLDASGEVIAEWPALNRLARLEPPANPARFGEVTVACDVDNPLLGQRGASRVYGPQKGLRPEDFAVADAAFERLVAVVRDQLGIDAAETPGAGAAGGLGYGLAVFLQARFESGGRLFAKLSGLESRIMASDLILSGEGAIDEQTLMGKGVGAVIEIARSAGKPVIGLGGVLKEPFISNPGRLEGFTARAIVPRLATSAHAMANSSEFLQKLAFETAKAFPAI